MKVIKNINNNYALAEDSAGNRLIISGKGIGFGVVPREITDVSMINRSFYDVDESYASIINEIPEEIINISTRVIDYARENLENLISPSIVFTLADHINFTIERYKKNLSIQLPIVYDIQHLFEKEMDVGRYGLRIIRKEMNVWLPEEEAAYIALHIINSEEQVKNNKENENTEIVNEISNIIEQEYKVVIEKSSINYSRFVSHIHYLLKRGKSKHLIESDNDKLFLTIKDNYPKSYVCSEKISEYLYSKLDTNITDEEKLYLMLHINRLCTREDCNQ